MILLLKRGNVFIDDEDYELISKYRWYIASHGYVRRSSDKVYLHRFLTEAKKGEVVDHINGDKLDNRRCNLRICTQKENMRNRSGNKNSKSKFKGVHKYLNGWKATIGVNGNKYDLGCYYNEEDAALAYNRKCIELHGEFSNLNDIEDDGRELITVLEENKTSKYKGVYLRGDKKKWVAQVTVNRKAKYLGSFNTQEEAVNEVEKYLEKNS